jgi:hypothetical protein
MGEGAVGVDKGRDGQVENQAKDSRPRKSSKITLLCVPADGSKKTTYPVPNFDSHLWEAWGTHPHTHGWLQAFLVFVYHVQPALAS